MSKTNWIRVIIGLFVMIIFYAHVVEEEAQAQSAIAVYVDGKAVNFKDVKPQIINHRTMVPVRPIAEAMGATVHWIEGQQTVRLTLSNQRSVLLTIQSPYIQAVQGKSYVKKVDEPAQLLQQRTMLPLRALGESLGYLVHWDQQRRTITFTRQPASYETVFPKYEVIGSIEGLHRYELDVFWLVNTERVKHQLPPLTLHTELSRVARHKSADMLEHQYFSHTSPTYGSPFDMMRHFGLTFQASGENIAAGYLSPYQAMNGWMNSEGHRRNILSTNFTQIGVGYVNGQTGYRSYWTQLFMR
jgi:uncharacterized YkwD family protein